MFGSRRAASHRRLILHIGMHKTGSTALQVAYSRAAPKGLQFIELHKRTPGPPLAVLYDPEAERNPVFTRRGLSPRAALRYRRKMRRRLNRMLRNRSASVSLLSAEYLSNAPPEMLEGLYADLAPHFDEVQVYGYLRTPQKFASSMFQQRLKMSSQPFGPVWPQYQQRFEAFERIFGRQNTHLKWYQRQRLVEADICQDFAQWTGIAAAGQRPATVNSSLSLPAVALLYLYRRNAQYPAGSNLNKIERPLLRALRQIDGPTFAFAPELIETQLHAEGADLAWAEARLGSACPETPVPQTTDPIASSADLLRAAARFVPRLTGGAEQASPQDANDAEAQAWGQMAPWLRRNLRGVMV
ncbi:MAG: hypothetical protein VX083_00700 [Pseudomonadota bacterium]|nr:hypothetical protein [Pseudomonadota bacterium]MEC8291985.1 hypothetical protein [Pseudomonadota bacterium]